MTAPRVPIVLGVAIVLAVSLAIVPAPTTAADPSIDVQVDGTPLPEGGSVTTTEGSSVSIDVSAETEIESIAIRVNGTTKRFLRPNSTSVDRTVEVEFEPGANRFKLLVDTGSITTFTGIVRYDALPPRVAYREPFEKGRLEKMPDEISHNSSYLMIAGDLYDTSSVESIQITRDFSYRFGGRRHRDQERHDITDPHDSFAQPVILGNGTNAITVRLTDANGHVRIHEFTVEVNDTEEPTIEVSSVTVSGSKAHIAGRVMDNVKVTTLTVNTGFSPGERFVIEPTSPEPDQERRRMEFNITVPVESASESVMLSATDVGGNLREQPVEVNHERTVEPDIRLNETTGITTGGQAAIRGTVHNGSFDRVVVETVSAEGEVIAMEPVVHNTTRRRAEFAVRLDATNGLASDPNGTSVRVRVRDTNGLEQVVTQELTYLQSGSSSASSNGTPTASATPPGSLTTTSTPTPRPNGTETVSTTPGAGGSTSEGGASSQEVSFLPFVSLSELLNLSVVLWVLTALVTVASQFVSVWQVWSKAFGVVSVVLSGVGAGSAVAVGTLPVVKLGAVGGLFVVWASFLFWSFLQ